MNPIALWSMLREYMNSANQISVPRLVGGRIPKYGTEQSAGADLAVRYGHTVEPHSSYLFDVDLSLAIPSGHFGFIKERSSIAGRNMWTLGGVIDSDYRGPIKVRLYNGSPIDQYINDDQRIAQIIFIPHSKADFLTYSQLPPSERGEGGFGSTGK